ncbi:MAG TPA: LamG-like jellyroll fold domain-containing protein, partial [Candidatus Acidoferrum sp.]|nr:LamG-like jellyroll fold domain-containing protein [Candidatus Acidoferrum sp.]
PDSANFTGANSATLTVLAVTPNDVGSYQLIASNVVLNVTYTVVTQPASLTIEQPALVGEWLDGSAAGTNLQDVSGYSPQGTHDGAGFGGVDNTFFTADVPPYRTGYSLGLPGGGTFSGIVISNSATGDPGYTNTYDGAISTYLTVSVWLKGSFGAYSAGWPSFFTKDEEAGGWGIRGDQWGSPGFTVRDHNAGTMFHGQNGGWDGNDDMSSLAGFDGNWHLYTGTYNSISGYRALYIDGVLSVWETGNQPYIPAPTSHVMIGAEQSNDNPLQPAFKFYDARIYNYELSAAEALALYTTLPPGTPAQIGIQPPASITTTCEGVTVQINAQSGGSPTLTNQWWFNGVKLVDGNYGGVAISGSSSDLLTIANVTTNYDGVYTLSVSNAFGGAVSSGCTLTVTALPAAAPPAGTLVGAWLTGAPTLADLSGYSPAGTHDASVQSGSTYWTNDVPPSAPAGTYSLHFSGAGLIVSNSSTLDGASYTSTYDLAISNSMTVVCWAKGYPGGWNPWVSKYGESGLGWQLRIDNNSPLTPCWTVRGAGGTEDMEAPNSSNDGNWHLYAGTYDLASGVDSLYIDGVLAIQQSGLGQYALSPPSHLMIGARDSGGNSFGNYFTGEIYGVRIYDTALSAAQVNYFLVTPPAFVGLPAITTGPNGRQLVLSWNAGTLLQATNLTGPWTPSGATPPYTNNLTGRQMFFRLSSP